MDVPNDDASVEDTARIDFASSVAQIEVADLRGAGELAADLLDDRVMRSAWD